MEKFENQSMGIRSLMFKTAILRNRKCNTKFPDRMHLLSFKHSEGKKIHTKQRLKKFQNTEQRSKHESSTEKKIIILLKRSEISLALVLLITTQEGRGKWKTPLQKFKRKNIFNLEFFAQPKLIRNEG